MNYDFEVFWLVENTSIGELAGKISDAWSIKSS
jgi:hypothetical protein